MADPRPPPIGRQQVPGLSLFGFRLEHQSATSDHAVAGELLDGEHDLSAFAGPWTEETVTRSFVASVYDDGRTYSNYVNGVEQGRTEIRFAPQGAGRSSIGVRINLVNYFKGAIHAAGFSRRALSPAEFLRLEQAAPGSDGLR